MKGLKMSKKIRKFLIYIIFLILIIKCGSIVFDFKTEETASTEESEDVVAYKKFDYGDYTTINLLHVDSRRS